MDDDISHRQALTVLVTAGPTVEDIDPVRFISNRSSGKMGIAIAEAAAAAGMKPILILGPTAVKPPADIAVIAVRSAEDMYRQVASRLPQADCLVMTAAVADYTPAAPLTEKLKKSDGNLTLELKRTKDILKEVAAAGLTKGKYIVGFALDIDLNVEEGRRKLRSKGMDAIVVNTAASFGSGRENAVILDAEGGEEKLGEVDKQHLASLIVKQLQIWDRGRNGS